MSTDVKLSQLIINRLTKAQYDAAEKSENELYIITDDESYEVQVSTMPAAAQSQLNRVVQYIGTTTNTYINGYWYKCVGTGSPVVYSWEQVNVQPQGDSLPSQSGNTGKFLTTDGTDASWAMVDALPDQTGQSGKFLTTDGTNTSWSDKPLVNKSTSNSSLYIGTYAGTTEKSYAILVGGGSNTSGTGTVGVGIGAVTGGDYSVAIGNSASCYTNNAIQISARASTPINYDANTFKVANANGNFEIMSADGTIPEARLADTTNASAGQVLTLDSNGNAVWADPMQFRTGSLVAADWVDNTATTGTYDQTITVQGITLNNNIMISPAPNSAVEYNASGILCSGQNTNSLSFSATTQPSNNLTINVLIFG